jgi:hypothetical protein
MIGYAWTSILMGLKLTSRALPTFSGSSARITSLYSPFVRMTSSFRVLAEEREASTQDLSLRQRKGLLWENSWVYLASNTLMPPPDARILK